MFAVVDETLYHIEPYHVVAAEYMVRNSGNWDGLWWLSRLTDLGDGLRGIVAIVVQSYLNVVVDGVVVDGVDQYLGESHRYRLHRSMCGAVVEG